MKMRWSRGLPGLLLLAGAGWPLLAAGAPAPTVSEPLALALAPLGPLRALVSSALWVDLLRSQSSGDSERVTVIARALLDVHPDLDVVREYLANQLIVTEARRVSDARRHDALIEAGLRLFEDGLAAGDDRRLRSSLAWTLAVQARLDLRFARVAQAHFGETAEDAAIDLLEGSDDPFDARTRGQLLAERGLAALQSQHDEPGARRDLAEAERALLPLAARDAASAEELLAPLRAALEHADEPRPPAPDQPAPEPPAPDPDAEDGGP